MIADVALGTITDEFGLLVSETRSSVGAERRRRDAAVLSIAKVCGLVFTIETLINSGNRGSVAVAEEVLNKFVVAVWRGDEMRGMCIQMRWREGGTMGKG